LCASGFCDPRAARIDFIVTGITPGSGKANGRIARCFHTSTSQPARPTTTPSTIEEPIGIPHQPATNKKASSITPSRGGVGNPPPCVVCLPGRHTPYRFGRGDTRVSARIPEFVVGEIAIATRRHALKAARDGPPRISTLHTTDATQTSNACSFYPPPSQTDVRYMLSTALRAIISCVCAAAADQEGKGVPAASAD